MKNLLVLLLFSSVAWPATRIVGPVYIAWNNGRAKADCVISWPAFNSLDGRPFFAGSTKLIIIGGEVDTQLEPTDTALPRFVYEVACTEGKTTRREYWDVPTRVNPVNVSSVRVNMPVSPKATIQWQQLDRNGAQIGQAPLWTGTSWQPGNPTAVAAWGTIIGTLANQSDLSNVLASKAHYAGTWSSGATYAAQELVTYSGATYISIQGVNLNHQPNVSPLWWVAVGGTGGGGAVDSVFGRAGVVTAQAGDYNTSQVPESGGNLYFTNARVLSVMAGLYEPPIAGGTTSQYWRGDKTWQALNTTAVAEASNLYFTNARVLSAMAGLYEPPIAGGATSQYWRGDKTWQALNTTAVAEASNLYFTNARAQAAMAGLYELPLTISAPLRRTVNTISCPTCGVPGLSSRTTAVFEGDSLAAGFGLTKSAHNTTACRTSLADATCQDWPSQLLLMSALKDTITSKNVFAQSGNFIADVQARYVTNVKPLVPGILFAQIGTNDINAGTSAATIQTGLSSYWSGARADGWKLAVFTIPRAVGFTVTTNTTRKAVNDWIRSRFGNGDYDYLIDTDRLLNSIANTTFYQGDQIHPTAAGQYAVARAVNAILQSDGNFTVITELAAVDGDITLFRGGCLYGDSNLVALCLNAASGSVLSYGNANVFAGLNFVTINTNSTNRLRIDNNGVQIFARSTDPGCTSSADAGKVWFDNSTSTIVFKRCEAVAGVYGWSSTAPLATALAADPADCPVGSPTIGVNASGVAQGCITLAPVATSGSASDIGLGTLDNARLSSGARIRGVGISIDGGGSTLTTGQRGYAQIPYTCTIIGWSAIAKEGETGSISVEVAALAASPPPAAPSRPAFPTNKISASAPIQVSSASSSSGGASEVSTWSTSRSQWDVFSFNVASVTSLTAITIQVHCQL